jgi:hypothetical protein
VRKLLRVAQAGPFRARRPAIASASASAICPASSTNSTSTDPRSSSRAHSQGVPAIRLIPSSPEGGNAEVSAEERTASVS